jgi:hypothetical protein
MDPNDLSNRVCILSQPFRYLFWRDALVEPHHDLALLYLTELLCPQHGCQKNCSSSINFGA